MQAGQRVRSLNDGQIGFIVERPPEDGGGLGVRLDRRAETIILPYSKSRWVADERGRLTPINVARIAYQADCALRLAHGEYGLRDWQALKEEQRIAWLNGPGGKADGKKLAEPADAERTALYAAIKGALSA